MVLLVSAAGRFEMAGVSSGWREVSGRGHAPRPEPDASPSPDSEPSLREAPPRGAFFGSDMVPVALVLTFSAASAAPVNFCKISDSRTYSPYRCSNSTRLLEPMSPRQGPDIYVCICAILRDGSPWNTQRPTRTNCSKPALCCAARL